MSMQRCFGMWGWILGLVIGSVAFGGVSPYDAAIIGFSLSVAYPIFLATLDWIDRRESKGL